jgi:hypothetical protein
MVCALNKAALSEALLTLPSAVAFIGKITVEVLVLHVSCYILHSRVAQIVLHLPFLTFLKPCDMHTLSIIAQVLWLSTEILWTIIYGVVGDSSPRTQVFATLPK